MTKQEAKQSLIEGKKIRHKSWMDGTNYFYLSDIDIDVDGDYLVFNDDHHSVGKLSSWYWHDNKQYYQR